MDWSCASWVNCCAISPTGSTVAFGGQDSSIHFVSIGAADPVHQVIPLNSLPLCDMAFLSDASLIAGGHDCNPMLFAGAPWRFVDDLDKKIEANAGAAAASGTAAAARAMFEKKTVPKPTSDAWKKHQSPITSIQKLSPPGAATCTSFSSTALDGRICQWDLTRLDHLTGKI